MTQRTRRQMLASLALAPTFMTAAACSSRRVAHGEARRIVTLAPNTTEILFAIGRGSRVVGVSRYDDYPAEVARLPRVGGGLDPSFEAIIALRPDTVLGTRAGTNRSLADRLERFGVRAIFAEIDSLAQIRDAITQFATLTNARTEGAALNARIDARLTEVRTAVGTQPRPRTLAVYGQRPLVIAGPHSFVDELLTIAGATNAATSGPRWPTISIEALLALQPEVLLDLTSQEGGPPLIDLLSPYTAIPAVRDRRVHRLDDAMLSRPGPRVGDAVALLARTLHPTVSIA